MTCPIRWIFRRVIEKCATDMNLCWICGPIRQMCVDHEDSDEVQGKCGGKASP